MNVKQFEIDTWLVRNINYKHDRQRFEYCIYLLPSCSPFPGKSKCIMTCRFVAMCMCIWRNTVLKKSCIDVLWLFAVQRVSRRIPTPRQMTPFSSCHGNPLASPTVTITDSKLFSFVSMLLRAESYPPTMSGSSITNAVGCCPAVSRRSFFSSGQQSLLMYPWLAWWSTHFSLSVYNLSKPVH